MSTPEVRERAAIVIQTIGELGRGLEVLELELAETDRVLRRGQFAPARVGVKEMQETAGALRRLVELLDGSLPGLAVEATDADTR